MPHRFIIKRINIDSSPGPTSTLRIKMASTEEMEQVIQGVSGVEVSEDNKQSKSAAKKAAKMEKKTAEKENKLAAASKAEATKATSKPIKKNAKIEGAALIGVGVDKDLDFAGWYQQVLTKGDLIDYYDVAGCYILKPDSYGIWETIQGTNSSRIGISLDLQLMSIAWFDSKIKAMGVRNCYFPMFVSQKVLEREKAHIEGFAAEVAWITKA